MCAVSKWLLPYASEMSVNIQMGRVDLRLVGQDLNDSRDGGRILSVLTDWPGRRQQIMVIAHKHTKQPGTHGVIHVVREELHLQLLLLLRGSGQEGWEEQQRRQGL